MGIHSIIVIKDKKDRYLQYFDEKWNSYLFLNCKLPYGDDSVIVQKYISDKLNIDTDFIKISLVGYKKHRKFSESAKIEKEYIHYFYNVELLKDLSTEDFIVNNVKYKWFLYEDLLNDPRIQKVNSDIVGFIKEFGM